MTAASTAKDRNRIQACAKRSEGGSWCERWWPGIEAPPTRTGAESARSRDQKGRRAGGRDLDDGQSTASPATIKPLSEKSCNGLPALPHLFYLILRI